MTRTVVLLMTILLAVLALSTCALGMENVGSLKEVFSNPAYPTTLKLSELTADWKCLNANGQSEAGGYMQLLAGMAGGGQLAGAFGTFYTKGDTLTLGQETYLVAYRRAQSPVNIRAMQVEGPKPEILKPDSPLSLALLNLQTAGSITDIRTFKMEDEIAAQKKMISDLYGEEYVAPDNEQGTRAQSMHNLKQIATALNMYMSDWDDQMPPMKTFDAAKTALMPYCKNPNIFVQPETGKPYMVNPILSNHKAAHINNPSDMVVFYEAETNQDGTRCAAFMDGHCARIPEKEWADIKRRSRIP
jgi:hypothetical protein